MAGINPERAARVLDTLEEVLNSIFLATGAVFEGSEDASTEHIAHSNARMKDFVPKALKRWEDSLMELDNQITQAQQILRRDLVQCRTRPEDAVQPSAPAQPEDASQEQAKDEPEPPAAAADTQEQKQEDQDSSAANTKPVSKPEQPTIDTSAAPPAQEDQNMDSAALDMLFNFDASPSKASPDEKASPAAPAAKEDSKENKDEQSKPDAKPTLNQAPDQTTSTTAPAENNIESSTSNNNTDIASLLPGLGDFANDEAFQGADTFNEMVNPENFMGDNGGNNNNFDQLNQDGFNFENTGGDFNFEDLLQLNDGDGQLNNDEFGKDFFNLG